jgi:hypothetical protein
MIPGSLYNGTSAIKQSTQKWVIVRAKASGSFVQLGATPTFINDLTIPQGIGLGFSTSGGGDPSAYNLSFVLSANGGWHFPSSSANFAVVLKISKITSSTTTEIIRHTTPSIHTSESFDSIVQLLTTDLAAINVNPATDAFADFSNYYVRLDATDTDQVGALEVKLGLSRYDTGSNTIVAQTIYPFEPTVFQVTASGVSPELEAISASLLNDTEIKTADNTYTIYASDGYAPIAVYDLYDSTGASSATNIYKRVRQP